MSARPSTANEAVAIICVILATVLGCVGLIADDVPDLLFALLLIEMAKLNRPVRGHR